MGKESDKKASSPYVVLENRPLDQWKVTELKEELKKRKLLTRGLKEELVKRLDEVVRAEMDEAKINLEIELNSEAQPEVQSDIVAEEAAGVVDHTGGEKTDVEMGLGNLHADDGLLSLGENMVTNGEGGVVSMLEESVKEVQEVSVETTTTTVYISEESGSGVNQQPRNVESKPKSCSPEERAPGSSDLISGDQVVEVSKVQSDSISIDTITNIEKNEIKDNVIADDVKLEIDVKPSKSESVEVSEHHMDEAPAEEKNVNNIESTDVFNEKNHVAADDVKLELDVKGSIDEENANNAESADIFKKNDSGDVGSSEKLNLDRSSGDDSMEEDGLESKQIDSKFSSDEVGDRSEKIEVKVDVSVQVPVEDATANKKFVPIEDNTGPSVTSVKRKPQDQEASENSEVVKRHRRWNTEGVKLPEQHSANHSASTTPKDAFQSFTKHTFSRSESTASQEVAKERVVPPSSKSPTTSLRVDNFLRPFTLKAVQELLGKTGTVVSFWMDQIKTHCYVTYASEEEAIETRNAVCNLQWPMNGGRLLMADFVDPQEVKKRVDPPPVTTVSPAITTQLPQPSPRPKQQLPPPPFLPPPPLSTPPARNRALPPPPPEKIDPPILTLDDLFKKTRATPRIYYLPLSDEQVAAKLSAKQ